MSLNRSPIKENPRILRRTAGEIKNYRTIKRILSAALALLAVTVVIVYIISVMYTKFGSFTVTVNKFDNLNYAISLSETSDFYSPTARLNSKASENITCISINDLPQELDNVPGNHSGDNYLAYTFHLKNVGKQTVNCTYQMYIANMTQGIERAVRVRLYRDGDFVDYAYTKNDGSGPEPGTTAFYNNTVITLSTIENFKPGDIVRFTVVIWLEGNDPECVDNIIGGQFKVDMKFDVTNVIREDDGNPYNDPYY